MIRPNRVLKMFHREYIKRESYTFDEAFKIYEMLYEEARSLGALKSKDWKKEIKHIVRLACILNHKPIPNEY